MIVLAAVLGVASPAFGDGGAVVARERGAGLLVTVFVAPVPLRAGRADVSVLVQDVRDGSAVVDAAVAVEISGGPLETRVARRPATHDQATNQLLYAAPVEVALSGTWQLRVEVRRGGEEVTVDVPLEAASALPPVARYWLWLALPVAVVGVFLLHQWLRDRARVTR